MRIILLENAEKGKEAGKAESYILFSGKNSIFVLTSWLFGRCI